MSKPGHRTDKTGCVVILLMVLLVVFVVARPLQAGHDDEAVPSVSAGGEQPGSQATSVGGQEHGESRVPAGYEIPPLWAVIPFVLLLLCIALLPMIKQTAYWWEQNRNRLFVALILSVFVIAYYWFVHPGVVDHHSGELISGFWAVNLVLKHAILGEYIPFIVLLFSLYVVSGGIQLEDDLPPKPATNMIFLGVGAALASLIGTTGAAMLLIRPLLQTNRNRKYVKHTVIFFIFLVCNIGGSLLPIGDPPLFLGYLKGVFFFWTFILWPQWLATIIILLVIYYIWDSIVYKREPPVDAPADDEAPKQKLMLRGKINFLWLLGVVLSVALLIPNKPFLGKEGFFIIPDFFREAMQIIFVVLSLVTTPKGVRAENKFHYTAIGEVAVLFLGIFICMQVPVEILQQQGPSMGLAEPWHFFWATGLLSSFLDNAPTYVVFFEMAKTLGGAELVAGVSQQLLIAISLGAVFMGANTYIGNGPNFMVKSIAEQSGIKMPSCFGYMLYSGVILMPIFIIITLVLNYLIGHWNLI